MRAVADGEVVYANALRGFGLLVIVDHGDDWMTLYGGNRELLQGVGTWGGGPERRLQLSATPTVRGTAGCTSRSATTPGPRIPKRGSIPETAPRMPPERVESASRAPFGVRQVR